MKKTVIILAIPIVSAAVIAWLAWPRPNVPTRELLEKGEEIMIYLKSHPELGWTNGEAIAEFGGVIHCQGEGSIIYGVAKDEGNVISAHNAASTE